MAGYGRSPIDRCWSNNASTRFALPVDRGTPVVAPAVAVERKPPVRLGTHLRCSGLGHNFHLMHHHLLRLLLLVGRRRFVDVVTWASAAGPRRPVTPPFFTITVFLLLAPVILRMMAVG